MVRCAHNKYHTPLNCTLVSNKTLPYCLVGWYNQINYSLQFDNSNLPFYPLTVLQIIKHSCYSTDYEGKKRKKKQTCKVPLSNLMLLLCLFWLTLTLSLTLSLVLVWTLTLSLTLELTLTSWPVVLTLISPILLLTPTLTPVTVWLTLTPPVLTLKLEVVLLSSIWPKIDLGRGRELTLTPILPLTSGLTPLITTYKNTIQFNSIRNPKSKTVLIFSP